MLATKTGGGRQGRTAADAVRSAAESEDVALQCGDFLSRDEFIHRWVAMPNLKFAELLHGVVYMPSPLSRRHAKTGIHVSTWLGTYSAMTPGCECGENGTWLMNEDDAPQPDTDLCILPEYGGQARAAGEYVAGAPEFTAEVCVSSSSYDLHQKRDVYAAAGVREYLAVLVREREVRWLRLIGTTYRAVKPSGDSIYRSRVFPGLWLDAAALLVDDLRQVLAVLQQGLASPEHAAFVQRLHNRRHRGNR